jgi:hypothetical protein
MFEDRWEYSYYPSPPKVTVTADATCNCGKVVSAELQLKDNSQPLAKALVECDKCGAILRFTLNTVVDILRAGKKDDRAK